MTFFFNSKTDMASKGPFQLLKHLSTSVEVANELIISMQILPLIMLLTCTLQNDDVYVPYLISVVASCIQTFSLPQQAEVEAQIKEELFKYVFNII